MTDKMSCYKIKNVRSITEAALANVLGLTGGEIQPAIAKKWVESYVKLLNKLFPALNLRVVDNVLYRVQRDNAKITMYYVEVDKDVSEIVPNGMYLYQERNDKLFVSQVRHPTWVPGHNTCSAVLQMDKTFATVKDVYKAFNKWAEYCADRGVSAPAIRGRPQDFVGTSEMNVWISIHDDPDMLVLEQILPDGVENVSVV